MRFAAATVDVTPISRLFRALGDATRLRIVALLSHGALCVCHLEAALDISQPNASRHLAILRNAGIVEARREGNWILYRLAPQADQQCRRQLKTIVSAFATREVLADDVRRLLKAKGPGACK
jgi:ArsR family transcriptional regulator, arsenate/arsenite/antimonite-responsive transcriptional repressor